MPSGSEDEPRSSASGEAHWPLSRVAVSGLLGDQAEVEIDLESDLTILTGENGSGKTTLLRALNAVGKGDWYGLSALPFEDLTLEFADGYKLAVDNSFEPPTIQGPGRDEEWAPPEPDSAEFRRMMSAGSPMPKVLRAQEWERRNRLVHGRDIDDIQTTEELAEMSGRIDGPDWLTAFSEQFRCTFLTTSRLEERRTKLVQLSGLPAIEEIPHGLSGLITRAQLDYSSAYEAAARVFPYRASSAIEAVPDSSRDSLERDVLALKARVSNFELELAEVGLQPEEQRDFQEPEVQPETATKPETLTFLSEFYSFRLANLEVLSALKSDLEVFSLFLNERLSGKTVSFNREAGLVISLDDGTTIEPQNLSSGEKQLVVIAYGLLFETPRKSVVLLDEPELSLHVSWLRGFVDSLLDMGGRRELQFVLATHSPSLIAGHDEKERSLDLLRAG